MVRTESAAGEPEGALRPGALALRDRGSADGTARRAGALVPATASTGDDSAAASRLTGPAVGCGQRGSLEGDG